MKISGNTSLIPHKQHVRFDGGHICIAGTPTYDYTTHKTYRLFEVSKGICSAMLVYFPQEEKIVLHQNNEYSEDDIQTIVGYIWEYLDDNKDKQYQEFITPVEKSKYAASDGDEYRKIQNRI